MMTSTKNRYEASRRFLSYISSINNNSKYADLKYNQTLSCMDVSLSVIEKFDKCFDLSKI